MPAFTFYHHTFTLLRCGYVRYVPRNVHARTHTFVYVVGYHHRSSLPPLPTFRFYTLRIILRFTYYVLYFRFTFDSLLFAFTHLLHTPHTACYAPPLPRFTPHTYRVYARTYVPHVTLLLYLVGLFSGLRYPTLPARFTFCLPGWLFVPRCSYVVTLRLPHGYLPPLHLVAVDFYVYHTHFPGYVTRLRFVCVPYRFGYFTFSPATTTVTLLRLLRSLLPFAFCPVVVVTDYVRILRVYGLRCCWLPHTLVDLVRSFPRLVC